MGCKMESDSMVKRDELKEKLIELKLKKRELILANKNTDKINEEIKELERLMKQDQAAI